MVPIASMLLLMFSCCSIYMVQGIYLELASTEMKCVYDLLKKDMLATGYYAVSKREQGQQTGVHITVSDPEGEVVFSTDNADEGKWAYAARIEGKFVTCVRNTNLLPKEIELKLKSGVEAKDLTEVAQREHLMPLGVELLRLEQVAEEVRTELKYLFQSEADMRDVDEETNSRVRFTTAFSLLVILGMGAWQVNHVMKFLAAKKVV
jgi:hypothetical protein